jgi:hypothetical protein
MTADRGPLVYENWLAAIRGTPKLSTLEYPLFTEAHIVGNYSLTDNCPYQFINTVAFPGMSHYRPPIVIREDHYLEHNVPSMNQTSDEQYHGGGLADEIAALISLCLGIRAKAGDASRVFEVSDNDPKGLPIAHRGFKPDPLLPEVPQRPILPRLLGTHRLQNMFNFANLPKISAEDALVLVRAARLYQEAVWIAESTPELSWLMLVSALETAANRWREAQETPLERLRASRPILESILKEKGGKDFVLLVAEQIAPYMGATRKFIDFVIEFLPEPPDQRPPKAFQHAWTKKAMKQSMQIIYKYRSRALHGGRPFPFPMCSPPKLGENNVEIPLGVAVSSMGGVWVAKDVPMLLHTFEYITRHALLKWWNSVVIQSSSDQPSSN